MSQPESRRTIRTVKVVVETVDLPQSDHDRIVTWASQNILRANQYMERGFVSTIVYDEEGNVIMFGGNGHQVTPETKEIIDDLVGDDTT